MKSVLCVWGGWEGHQPKQCVERFAAFLAEKDYHVEISNTLDSYLDAPALKSLDLIVQCVTMATVTPEQEQGLLDAVASGVGFAGWHGGVADAFRFFGQHLLNRFTSQFQMPVRSLSLLLFRLQSGRRALAFCTQ